MQVGIDLGTTYTAAAVSGGGRSEARIVALGARSLAVPSVVYVEPSGAYLYGEVAAQAGRADPVGLAREFKRRIGDPTPIQLRGTPLSAEALSAQLLRWTLATVAEREGEVPDTVVLTHPANWGPFRLEMLDEIARQAGVARYQRCTEPEAAAIWYAAQTRVDDGSVIAVYDLGGGTFDTAVLRKAGERFEVLGRPEGIDKLGGIDFDDAVLGYVREMAGPVFARLDPLDPEVRRGLAQLRADCVEAKEQLSTRAEVTIPVAIADRRAKVLLDRAAYEARVEPLVDLTVRALARTIESSGLDPDHLRSVLLVGGASRAPLVERLVAEELGHPVALDVHPKEAVALGAAHLASLLAGDAPSSTPPVSPPQPPLPPPPTEPPKAPVSPLVDPPPPTPKVDGPPAPNPPDRPAGGSAYAAPERKASTAPKWLPGLLMVALLGAAAGGVGLLVARGLREPSKQDDAVVETTLNNRLSDADEALMASYFNFVSRQADAVNQADDQAAACQASQAALQEDFGPLENDGIPKGLTGVVRALATTNLRSSFTALVRLRLSIWERCTAGASDYCTDLIALNSTTIEFLEDYATQADIPVEIAKSKVESCEPDPQPPGTG